MRNWDGREETGFCQADDDAENAERTCKILGIPFVEVSFIKEYWNHVFEYVLSVKLSSSNLFTCSFALSSRTLLKDYQMGLTPNPDILCNCHIKFDSFLNYAKEKLGADCIATGHYSQTALVPDSSAGMAVVYQFKFPSFTIVILFKILFLLSCSKASDFQRRYQRPDVFPQPRPSKFTQGNSFPHRSLAQEPSSANWT